MFYDFLLTHVLPDTFYMYADVGPKRPASMSPIARRTLPTPDPQAEGAEGGELIQNLEGIARGIPKYSRLADVLMAYQRHTVGVPSRLHQLLRRLVHAVTCYHEHHVDYLLGFIPQQFFERHIISGCT